MADVQISNTPGTESGSASWVWAIVVIALLGIIAWFLFFRGGAGGGNTDVDVDVNPPATGSPPPTTPPPTTPPPGQ